jgi:predicted transcriptional regulator
MSTYNAINERKLALADLLLYAPAVEGLLANGARMSITRIAESLSLTRYQARRILRLMRRAGDITTAKRGPEAIWFLTAPAGALAVKAYERQLELDTILEQEAADEAEFHNFKKTVIPHDQLHRHPPVRTMGVASIFHLADRYRDQQTPVPPKE